MRTWMKLNCLAGVMLAVAWNAGAGTGSVTGTVVFEGEAPTMRQLDLGADPVCAAKHKTPPRLEVLVLGEGQTMANIIVKIVEGLPEDKTYSVPEEPAVLDQAGCIYSPHVLVVQKGQDLTVRNPDGTMHNVHGFPKKNREFNRTMPKSRKEMTLTFEKVEEPFRIKCDIHSWMSAYCEVIDHPFFDVTEKDGQFEISGLAPGEYTVQAWHERLGPQTAVISVKAGEAATADFTFKRP